MEAATQRRLKDLRIKSVFQDNTLRARASTRLKWCYYPIQPLTRSYQLVISLRVLVERASDLGFQKKTVQDYYSPEYMFIESSVKGIGRQRSSYKRHTISNNSGLQKQKLDNVTFYDATSKPVDEAVFVKANDETKGFSLAESIEENNVQQAIDVESTLDNDARDQACELEMKVLVDSNGVIGVGENKNNKGVDKEVQHSIYTLHVLIPFLKRLNDKYIKKKKMEAAIKRRLRDSKNKSDFQDNTLRER
ncbi:hypothetical protein Tco_0758388 [Tanacetum coccineum]